MAIESFGHKKGMIRDMKIVIASEHAGFELKEIIKKHLIQAAEEVIDVGVTSSVPVDYPPIAENAAVRVASGEYDLGILICGTGTGMCISASKVTGIRPALCTNEFMAEMARRHNDANILCLGSWVTGSRLSMSIVDAFIKNSFDGERHAVRVDLIKEIELRQRD